MHHKNDTLRFQGRPYVILGRLSAGGKRFLILDRLGNDRRRIYQVFDRRASLGGELRCLHVLPYSQSTKEHLQALSCVAMPQANLPTILECHRRQDDIVVVTRWIDGPTLRDYLREARRGREPWPSAPVSVNLIGGLAHACWLLYRRLGLVHGDLKPDNLIICRTSHQLVPIDFGSAWRVETTTHRQTADGTSRPYAAPELLTGQGTPGFRSDQFSVSVILYEMLTGEIPYDRLGGLAGVEDYRENSEILLTPPTHILRHNGYLPASIRRGIDEIVQRGLSLAPGNRYQDGRQWLNDLDGLRQEMSRKIEISKTNEWLLQKISRLGRIFYRRST